MTQSPADCESPARFLAEWREHGEKGREGFLGNTPYDNQAVRLQPRQLQEHCFGLKRAVIADHLEHYTATEGKEHLAAIRNALVPSILVLVREHTPGWTDADFYGLGFRHTARFPHKDGTLLAYEYHIATYNPKRDWNNSRFWANPENFGKYWW